VIRRNLYIAREYLYGWGRLLVSSDSMIVAAVFGVLALAMFPIAILTGAIGVWGVMGVSGTLAWSSCLWHSRPPRVRLSKEDQTLLSTWAKHLHDCSPNDFLER
jgi:hypothetical protein